MKNNEDIEILIKLPSKWFNYKETDLTSMFALRERVKEAIREQILPLQELELPKIKVTEEEVKKVALKLLAEEVMDTYREYIND